ncbi:hypothetical protein HD554DRAFT_2039923 [Boletus coccyginus]|nr:hypothetical protein HD554DRAFT_2043120 [Boletus coccyginus]KAI9458244.1 hypothetical protein HD554DRAFT_2042158 [Boletus coccyginus]KAI9463006.1 hypothetical protein HD554DRAFT_2288244 [Boletus coccyginus]KAI9567046.1 hypothetical protein HD554DRAFT_2039923 [Boletus coccyginus]
MRSVIDFYPVSLAWLALAARITISYYLLYSIPNELFRPTGLGVLENMEGFPRPVSPSDVPVAEHGPSWHLHQQASRRHLGDGFCLASFQEVKDSRASFMQQTRALGRRAK